MSLWSTPRGLWSPNARIADDATGFAVLLQVLADAGDSAEEPIPVAIETGRVCWWRACEPPVGRCSRSTRWRCRATGIGTRSHARNPTPATRSCWPTSCAPISPRTGRCRRIPNSPRPSLCSPVLNRTPSGTAPARTTSCVRSYASTTRGSWQPSPTNDTACSALTPARSWPPPPRRARPRS